MFLSRVTKIALVIFFDIIMVKMKRNKELDEAFTAFIDDLKLFLKETKEFSKDKSKKIESY